MVRSSLIIVGVAGATGVDEASQLFRPPPASLHDDVAAAVRGLHARGVMRIRVAAPFPLALPNVESVTANVTPALFADMEAFAWLGVPAPAGSSGFAAHTRSLHAAWYGADGELGEWEIALGIAADAGTRALFASGDDIVCAASDGVARVLAKTALSRARARSRPLDDVRADLERTAREAPPVQPRPLRGTLTLVFARRWQAARAARVGGERRGDRGLAITQPTFTEAVAAASACIAETESLERDAIRTLEGPLPVALAAVLGSPISAVPPPRPVVADEVLATFLARTDGPAEWQRAVRALVLHALAGHAPAFFARHGLARALEAATMALSDVPHAFPPGMPPMLALARMEAAFVRSERTGVRPSIDAEACVQHLATEGAFLPWLVNELGAIAGVPRAIALAPGAFAHRARREQLRRIAYELVLETRFFHRSLPASGWEVRTEILALAAPEASAEERVGLAAELAVALQAAGEDECAPLATLLAWLARCSAQDTTEAGARITGFLLLALARAVSLRRA